MSKWEPEQVIAVSLMLSGSAVILAVILFSVLAGMVGR